MAKYDNDEEYYSTGKLPKSVITERDREKIEELEIELSEEHFMKLSLLAHQQNITLNKLVNNILEDILKV